MPDDWNDTLLNIGFAEVDEDDIFGDLDEYGLLPPEADGGDERGQMMVGGGFGNLYYYELHDKKKRVRAKKYAIPVTGGKRGDFKFFVGETAEQAMVKYRKGRASGDVETVSDIVKADTKLKEAHGTMNTDIWHVKVWKSLGPVEAKAPPSQRPSATTVAEAAAALEAAEEEKELLAIEKAFSPSEILKEGKNVVYIVVGIGVVAVIGTVAFLVYRHGTPTGVLTGMLQKRKNPSTISLLVKSPHPGSQPELTTPNFLIRGDNAQSPETF